MTKYTKLFLFSMLISVNNILNPAEADFKTPLIPADASTVQNENIFVIYGIILLDPDNRQTYGIMDLSNRDIYVPKNLSSCLDLLCLQADVPITPLGLRAKFTLKRTDSGVELERIECSMNLCCAWCQKCECIIL